VPRENGTPSTRRIAAAALLVAGAGVCACSAALHPAALAPPPRAAPDRVLLAPATARLPTGGPETLPAGTVLAHRGRIAQGEVWRPLDRAMTVPVDSSDAHEGWVVLSGDLWVGFYLPVARAFTPLRRPVPVATRGRA